MSYRRGTKLIAGAGATPYINERTGNWEICGIDTGVQAIPTKVSVDEYNNLVKSGTINEKGIYFITDASPILYRNKTISSSNWVKVSDDRYTNTIVLAGVTATDTIMVDIASSVSDDDYLVYKNALAEANVQRFRSSDGAIVIVSSTPVNVNLLVDITVTKCIVGE